MGALHRNGIPRRSKSVRTAGRQEARLGDLQVWRGYTPSVRVRRFGLWLCLLLAVPAAGHADGPILHEFIEADAAEDLELGTTTPDGRMPAAARTPSGVI